ncbi:hypothetical protein ACROSR_16920 [Roseovarius tibetensis]|uniref:hypothetical protein n=1 Tax=Roseovarius tibetensis TaxID=2685897 RepID=UPI003D7F8D00
MEDIGRVLQGYSIGVKPVGWEKDVPPGMNIRGAQEVINESALAKCDILIGIIGHKPGKKTKFFNSGTIEEIEKFIEIGKPTQVYFKKVDHDEYDSDSDRKRISRFKNSLFERGLSGSFKNSADLFLKVNRNLSADVHKLVSDWEGRVCDLLHEAQKSTSKFTSSNRIVSLNLGSLNGVDFRCWCVCFELEPPAPSNIAPTWKEKTRFEVEEHGYTDSTDILSAMGQPYNSFKFFLSVPKSDVSKCRSALLDNNLVVTGKGAPDDDADRWQIWFLASGAFIHPLIEAPELANHSLFDLCVV